MEQSMMYCTLPESIGKDNNIFENEKDNKNFNEQA